jgi:L-amino acid N-acyltransferase YncA
MDTNKLTFRRALDEDLAGIHELLERNFAGNLSESQKKDGFLSIRFDGDQLREMADDGIMIVALSGSRVVGFLSTQTCRYNLTIPIAGAMIETLSDSIEQQRTLVCGPVCIDSEFRGQGVFEQMYAHLIRESSGIYTTGITFVSAGNPRSIAAHRDKLGMTPAGQIEHEGATFQLFRYRF